MEKKFQEAKNQPPKGGEKSIQRPLDLNGILVTANTPLDYPFDDFKGNRNGGEALAIRYEYDRKEDVTKSNADDPKSGAMVKTPENLYQLTRKNPNLCFALGYRLILRGQSSLNIGVLPTQIFYPFQRGFFTRLEADVDALLLDYLCDKAMKPSVDEPPTPKDPIVPRVPQPLSIDEAMHNLTLNKTSTFIVDKSSKPALTVGSPTIVSPLPPSKLPHAKVWKAATTGEPVIVGGVAMQNVGLLVPDARGQLAHFPLAQASAAAQTKVAEKRAETKSDTENVAMTPVEPTVLPGSIAVAALKTTSLPPTLNLPSGNPPAELATPNENIPKGFVLTGTIKLFNKFDEQVYTYNGSASTGVRQIVPVKLGTFKLSDYVPSFEGSDFDALEIKNTELIFNEYTTLTDRAGTWLQTDLTFSGPLQPISDLLKNVFQQDKPILRVQGFLSPRNDWTQPIDTHSLALRATLPSLSIHIGDLLVINELGVSIGLIRQRQPWAPYDEKWTSSIGFFGSATLDTPADKIAPMTVGFSMTEAGGALGVILDVDEDETSGLGFCGIEGLRITEFILSTSFALGSAPSLLAFEAHAVLSMGNTSFDLSGYYSKAEWAFYCEVEDFSFNDLRNFFESMFDAPLHVSDHDVVVDDLVFIADSTGMSFSGKVTIEGYTSSEASISISNQGVHVSGAVDDVQLAGDITLKKAGFDVFIGRTDDTTLSGPGTSFRFAINGTVAIGSRQIDASLYFDKSPEGNLLWTVTGSFTGFFSIANLVPELQDTFLDLSLQNAAFIASNVDGAAATGATIPVQYPIVKGVQVAATLEGPMDQLDRTLNRKDTPTAGLTLQAMYSATSSSFEIAVHLATPQAMSMKDGSVSSGPISLLIQATPLPQLVINADFFVKVPNQDPLKFSGGIAVSVSEAKLYIELADQWWNNPFGLSQHLRLGPDLALQIGIAFSGGVYPSELGIAAGLVIGNVSGKAALSVSETPNDELIMVEVDSLGIKDLVTFASTLFETDMPQLDDFLHFKKLSFYLSTGTTIGTIIYPPGASFTCDAILFGHEASLSCGVNKAQKEIQVRGSLQPIDIGPLSVSGYDDGSNAEFNVTVGTSSQSVHISGAIRLGDLGAKVEVDASFLPTTTFSLKTDLDFSAHLVFELDAVMRDGSFTSFTSLENLDFDVHASLHQDILDWIVAQVNMQILAAKHAMDDGIDTAVATLKKAQDDFDADVKAAQTLVDSAKSAYDLKVAQVNGAFASEMASSGQRTTQLQNALDDANRIFRGAEAQAKLDLTVAQENRTQLIRRAQQNVQDARADGDRKLDDASRDLNAKQDDMNHQFGDLIGKINNARNAVNDATSEDKPLRLCNNFQDGKK